MNTETSAAEILAYVDLDQVRDFQKHKYPTSYLWTVLHELLGHGTGKMVAEDSNGNFNFDEMKPPINPLTGSPITSWHLPGQSWTGQFAEIATTVTKCRAEFVGAYLIDNIVLLNLFGFNKKTESTAEDRTTTQQVQIPS
jgi:dipeptidyl-peptidase III